MMVDVRIVVSCKCFSSLLFSVNISFARLDIELAHVYDSKMILIKKSRSCSKSALNNLSQVATCQNQAEVIAGT
jgi:hypothetical protein